MKKLPLALIMIISLSGVISEITAQTYELRGSLRGWVRGFTHSPYEIDLTESRLKLELLSTWGENTAFHTRTFLTHNDNDNSGVKIDLKQAYIDYYTDLVNIRIGKQIMTWGKADEINPTDVLNPQSLSNILEDKIDRKIGLFALKSNLFFWDYNLEIIWKPEFKPIQLPNIGSSWDFSGASVNPMLPPYVYPVDDYPGNGIDETEWAFSLSKTISMYDFSLHWFDGWENILSKKMYVDPLTGFLMSRTYFNRTRMLGGSFAGSIGTVGIWGEGAYFDTQDDAGSDSLIKNPYIQIVVGSDYTFSNGIKVNCQYLQEFITKIDDDIERDREENIFSKLGSGLPLQQALTTRIGKGFGSGEVHSVELFGIFDLKDFGYLMGPKLKLSPQDAVTFEFGAALFNGDSESMFGKFTKNDLVYVKCLYSF